MTKRVRFREISDELGDAYAPPGSRSWAIHIKDEIRRYLRDSRDKVRGAQLCLKAIRDREGWRHLRGEDGLPFSSFDDFCLERYPFGGEIDPKVAVAIIEADPNES
jgi:hypothetical protein